MILRGLIEAIFPPICAACGQCGREPFCRVCSEALVPIGALDLADLDAAYAAFEFGGPVAEAIRNLKYEGRPDIGRALAPVMQVGLTEVGPHDLVIPVPLSPPRLRKRRFNQSMELLRGLDVGPDVALAPYALTREHSAAPQAGLGRLERLRALTGRFHAGPEVEGRVVVLVDDVITTGATLAAAASALRKAGAERVQGLALAYTVGR